MSTVALLSPQQVARGTTALAGVFSHSAGTPAAFEASANIAQALLGADALRQMMANGERLGPAEVRIAEMSTADLIADFLRTRRNNFPERWEGALTDEGIESFAARGGAAWAKAVRAARAA